MKNLHFSLRLFLILLFFGLTIRCSKTDDNTPAITIVKTWASVAPGENHTTAVRSDGTLWTWGLVANARIGINPIKYDSIPKRVGIDSDWVAVSSGQNHTIASKSNGTLWAIGANDWQQLGIGTDFNYRVTPTQIGTDRDWQYFAAGNYNAIAVKNSGELYKWGYYSYPSWNETINADDSPVFVSNLTNLTQIASGGVHNLAVKTDGSLWTWGRNSFGELGNGGTIDSSLPVRIGTDNNWKSVSAGRYHSFGLKTNGTLWAWGENIVGQLGIGSDGAHYYSPMQIGTASDWSTTASGITHGLALKNNGTLWAWGNNYYGQLGNGSTTNSNAPVQIGNGNNWIALYPGFGNTFAKKTDGSLWAWGNNVNGQLGNGSTTNVTTPVLIGCPQL